MKKTLKLMFLIINTYKASTNNETKELEKALAILTLNEVEDNRKIINLNIFLSSFRCKFIRIDNSPDYTKEIEAIEKGIIRLKEFIHKKFLDISFLKNKTENEKTLLKEKLQETYDQQPFEIIDLRKGIYENFDKFIPLAYKRLKEANTYNSIDYWDFKDYSGYGVENKRLIIGSRFREI